MTDPIKVLIVDDDVFERDCYNIMFQAEGVTAESASSADEAVLKALIFQPDMILLDLNLGDSSGFQVIKRLRTHKDTKGIPVIFISSDIDVENVRQGFYLGAADYIQKGSDFRSLIRYVKEFAILESISSNLQRIKEILDK